MQSFLLSAVFSGVLFALNPLIISRSGLSGVSATLLSAIAGAVVISAIAAFHKPVLNGSWWLPLAAGFLGSVASLIFVNTIMRTPHSSVGIFIIIVLVTQVSVNALYHAWVNGGIDLKTGIGLLAAVIAAILLVPKG